MRLRHMDRPSGVSFSLPELLLTQSWAEFHDVRMVVELDYAFDGQEYEEVISLYRTGGNCRRCLMWRTAEFVVIQPIIGRMSRFSSLSSALDSFRLSIPEAPLSDIVLGLAASLPSAGRQAPTPSKTPSD